MLIIFILLTITSTAALFCVLLGLLTEHRRQAAGRNRVAAIRRQRRQAERRLRRTAQAGVDALFLEAFAAGRKGGRA